MYLNNNKKTNTNIDSELVNKMNINSTKENKISLFFSSKIFKYIIIGLLALIIIIGIIFIIQKNKKDYFINLIGEENITIYKDSNYFEIGYDAYDSKGKKHLSEVDITGQVDTSKPGEYEIVYKLKDVVKTRKVVVSSESTPETYINLLGNKEIYLDIGEEYQEYGYDVYDGKSILKYNVKTFSDVNTSKSGTYFIVYSVTNNSGFTIIARRTIIVK